MKPLFGSRSISVAVVAATLMLPFAGVAHAQPDRRDDHRPVRRDDRRDDHRGPGGGAILGGVLLGLGAAAVVGGVIAAQPAYAPPPPVYYAPPPPAYYAPPPPVYGY